MCMKLRNIVQIIARQKYGYREILHYYYHYRFSPQYVDYDAWNCASKKENEQFINNMLKNLFINIREISLTNFQSNNININNAHNKISKINIECNRSMKIYFLPSSVKKLIAGNHYSKLPNLCNSLTTLNLTNCFMKKISSFKIPFLLRKLYFCKPKRSNNYFLENSLKKLNYCNENCHAFDIKKYNYRMRTYR